MTQQETNADDDGSPDDFELPVGDSEDQFTESAIDCVDRLSRISYQRALLRRLESRYLSRSRT